MMDKKENKKNSIIKLLLYLKNFKFYVVFIVLLCLISTLCMIIGPYVLGSVTNEIGVHSYNMKTYGISFDFSTVQSKILYAVIIYGIVLISQIGQNVIAVNLNQKLCKDLRNKIYKKIFNVPVSSIENKDSGDIMSLFTNDIDIISQSLSSVLVQVLASFITVVGIAIVMIIINFYIALAILIFVPILFIFIYIFIKKSQTSFNEQQNLLGQLNNHIEESFYGLDTIVSYNCYENNIDTFKKYNDKLRDVGLKAQFNSRLFLPVMETTNKLGYFLIVLLGSVCAINGFINVGYIQAYIQYIQSFMQPFISFGQINNLFSQLISASNRVFDFLELEENKEPSIKESEPDEVFSSIKFNNVNFSYDKNRNVLDNINLKIKKGDKVAIIGHTGSGKTTILSLLLKFYNCDTGEILLNDKNIKDINYLTVRNKVAYISQEPWLFDGTIEENLRFANEKATKEQIIAASKESYLFDVVQGLPNKFNFYVSNGGSNLSKGQKQLMSICRAILANKEILILDEASSSIDSLTEYHVQRALIKLLDTKTSITVAHRLNTIINSDYIVVLDFGKIVEIGSHNNLINKRGYYYEYYNKQFIVS